ncbi:MAG: hypothetical protein HRU30_20710 [Rhodobacteraceae bacterium]|nr:hypothetical protein [Paracoccaceae bacterium]
MMSDLVDTLPPTHRRMVRHMAQSAGVSEGAIAREILRAYLDLAREAPSALPMDCTKRQALSAVRSAR